MLGGCAGGGFEGVGFGVAEDYEDFLGHFGGWCLFGFVDLLVGVVVLFDVFMFIWLVGGIWLVW